MQIDDFLDDARKADTGRKPKESAVSSLKQFGLGAYKAMKSAQDSSLLQAMLQCYSPIFRDLSFKQRLAVVRNLIFQGFPQDLYGICSTLDINCVAFLLCKTKVADAVPTLPKRLLTHWQVKRERPWALLVTDGSGMLWLPVKASNEYMLSFQDGHMLYEHSSTETCKEYPMGSIVLWSGEVWTIVGRKQTSIVMYILRSNKDFSEQRQVSASELEASVAPEAMTPAELANRTEDLKRTLAGIITKYTSVDYDIGGLESFAHDTAS